MHRLCCIVMCKIPYSYPAECFSKQVNKTCWEDFQVSNNWRSAGYHLHWKSLWLIFSILFRFFTSVSIVLLAVLNYNSRIGRKVRFRRVSNFVRCKLSYWTFCFSPKINQSGRLKILLHLIFLSSRLWVTPPFKLEKKKEWVTHKSREMFNKETKSEYYWFII